MAKCFNCSSTDGHKQWYSFSVDYRKLPLLDKYDVKDGRLTKLLHADCARQLDATPTANPYKTAEE